MKDQTALVSAKTSLHSLGAREALFFVVTPSGGAPRLYLAEASPTAWPSPTNYTQADESTAPSKTLTVSNTTSGTYHVGVFAARSTSAQLSVALSTECLGDAVSLNQLQPGVQVSGATAVLSRDCYKFTAPQPQPVVVAVMPQSHRRRRRGAARSTRTWSRSAWMTRPTARRPTSCARTR